MSPIHSPRILEYEDVPSLLGSVIELTFQVDDESRRLFERGTLMDRAYAGESDLEGDVVEGFHLLSLLDALTHPFLRFNVARLATWNYGLDRVRFIRPVRLGDSLQLRAMISEVRAKETGTLIRLDCRFFALGPAEPETAAVVDWLVFVAPRLRADLT